MTLSGDAEYIHPEVCPVRDLLTQGSTGEKRLFREQIRGCEVNLEGRLMVIYPAEGLKIDHYINELTLHDDDIEDLKERIGEPIDSFEEHAEGDTGKLKKQIGAAIDDFKEHIGQDIKTKEDLVNFWRNELRQMHLEVYAAAIDVEGQLCGYSKDEHGRGRFSLTVEPILSEMKLSRILDAAVQLRFDSFGRSTFPWETLAAEAGIERLQETKLIFHRLAMLASYYFKSKRASAGITDGMGHLTELIFTELDGEWTIRIQFDNADGTDIQKKRREAQKAIQDFHDFVARIINTGDGLGGSAQELPQRRRLILANDDLAYLFDEEGERGRCRGIVFPEPQSILARGQNRPTMGINMVISGPAGVGKSTLAMELIVRGRIRQGEQDVEKTISAYYSLEQPLESIRQLAVELGLKDGGIVSFHPNPSNMGVPNNQTRYVNLYEEILMGIDHRVDHVLLLPNLAPHSLGDTPDEDRLFWFRYKQVARLIEANRAHRAKRNHDFCLSVIVLDNLNAFSHHPLARQRVNQLFRLISWGGVLGVHIVEQNPSEKFRVFQAEVEALSDIAVHLGWNDKDYRYKAIEVMKSRCQRNVLGLHPFKIRRVSGETKAEPGFTVFPSLHTQVARIEKDDTPRTVTENVNIWKNKSLRELVNKERMEGRSNIASDAFVILSGRSGGHKLALGLDYINEKTEGTLGLVLNMGQPIYYDTVAGYTSWYGEGPQVNCDSTPWPEQKVVGECYSLDTMCKFLSPAPDSVVILNFQPGFLLPEEFVHTILKYLDIVEGGKFGGPALNVDRVLFNSTAHLASRFPLLDKDPLILTTLVRVLKKRAIGLMIIAVEETGNQERIESLAAMADVKLNIHHLGDKRVPPTIMTKLYRYVKMEKSYSARLISSDNVTGKDYKKKYSILDVSTDQPPVLKITSPEEYNGA